MNRFKNSGKQNFLASIPTCSIEANGNDHAARSKFNFSYFDVQPAGQAFSDWDHAKLVDLLDKLKGYCKRPLSDWENQRIGKDGRVLSIYDAYPANSDFKIPKHVPHEARWGRFRLDQATRLIGFVLPNNFHAKLQRSSGHLFCCNTFYVVFLDRDHRFYKTDNS